MYKPNNYPDLFLICIDSRFIKIGIIKFFNITLKESCWGNQLFSTYAFLLPKSVFPHHASLTTDFSCNLRKL